MLWLYFDAKTSNKHAIICVARERRVAADYFRHECKKLGQKFSMRNMQYVMESVHVIEHNRELSFFGTAQDVLDGKPFLA